MVLCGPNSPRHIASSESLDSEGTLFHIERVTEQAEKHVDDTTQLEQDGMDSRNDNIQIIKPYTPNATWIIRV